MWADSSTKTEGFEKATAGSNYQSTVTISEDDSDCGIGWKIYYGTPSTNDKISGNNSAQMRYYNNKDDRGYVQSTTAVEGLSNVAFKARVSSLDMKLTVSYSADGSAWTALATNVALEKTGAQGVKEFNYDIPSGGKYIKIEVAEGSTQPSSGNIKLIIDDVVFTYSADPEPEQKALYLKLSADWAGWPAKYAMYYFKSAGDENGWSDFMTVVDGETDVYTGTIPVGFDKVIMVRLDGEATEPKWDKKWSQTVNLDVPTNDNNLFTVTSGGTGDACDGEWSKYVAPTPPEDITLYLINNLEWETPTAYAFKGGVGEATWPGKPMTKTDDKVNGFDVYSYTFKDNYTSIIFNDGASLQTVDLVWDKAKPYFVPGDKDGAGKYAGDWYATKEAIPAPPTPKYHIAGGWTDWKLVELAVATDEKTATHKAELAKGDYEFKIVRTVGTDTTWLTKANAGQAYGLHREWVGVADVKDQADENLKVTADEGGKYVFTWTFANDSIGITFPAKRAFNETWGVGAETAVAAGTKYVDNFAVTIETVYATTRKTNARKFDAYAFTHAIQVRNADYPSAETPAGTEQSGSTSLVITAKEDVDLTFFYNRQTTSESTGDAESNDNKDMKVFDQAAPTTAMEAEFRVVWMQEDKKYVNAVKTISLVKGHTYTVSAKGTTIQLSGIRYATDAEAPVANYFIVGNAEVFGGWSTFIPVYEETFEVKDLAAGDYAFRLCMNDGVWTDDYGFAQLTVKPEGVSTDDHNNICFKLKEKSDFKVTYKPAVGDDAAVFTVVANFYVPEKKDLFLVPGVWAEGSAKINAWIWGDELAGRWAGYFAPKAENNDTLTLKIEADADSIIFVRFKADADVPTWDGGEGYIWNTIPKDTIDKVGMTYTITDWEAGTWKAYVAPVPVLADGFYLIGQKGWDVAALSADLLFAANPDNEGEYQLSVTLVKDEGIKVVRVESDVIKQWYPDGEGNEYKVDDAHAGQKTIYFKPDYVADWAAFGGYIYIEANQPTGLDQLAVDAKAVKAIIGGQLFIIRNGKTYTAQGVMVR